MLLEAVENERAARALSIRIDGLGFRVQGLGLRAQGITQSSAPNPKPLDSKPLNPQTLNPIPSSAPEAQEPRSSSVRRTKLSRGVSLLNCVSKEPLGVNSTFGV